MTKKKPSGMDQIIALFGGIRPMARALNHPTHLNVQGWKIRGKIPYWRHDEIFRAGRRKKIKRAVLEAALNEIGKRPKI